MNYEVVIELKYLPKKDGKQLEEKCRNAKLQLQKYIETERFNRQDTLGIWAVFCGTELSEWGTTNKDSL